MPQRNGVIVQFRWLKTYYDTWIILVASGVGLLSPYSCYSTVHYNVIEKIFWHANVQLVKYWSRKINAVFNVWGCQKGVQKSVLSIFDLEYIIQECNSVHYSTFNHFGLPSFQNCITHNRYQIIAALVQNGRKILPKTSIQKKSWHHFRGLWTELPLPLPIMPR